MSDNIRHTLLQVIASNLYHEPVTRDRVFYRIVLEGLQDVDVAGDRLIGLYVSGV